MRAILFCIFAMAMSGCGETPGSRTTRGRSFDDLVSGIPDSTVSYYEAAMRVGSTSPLEVVERLAVWDMAGYNLSTSVNADYDSARSSLICWIPEENCQNDEPAWDSFVVTQGFSIAELPRVGDTAFVELRYRNIAEGTAEGLSPIDPREQHIVRLLKLNDVWRVVSPKSQAPPHVAAAVALRILARSKADSSLILEAVQRSR